MAAAEVTTCGPCGANLIRWSAREHWANTQTGTYYCAETAHHRHQRNPDAGIVTVLQEALIPMLVGVPWVDGVPLADAGYLGPRYPGALADEGIDLWPMDAPFPPPAPEPARCSVCGLALVRGIKLRSASLEAPWVAQDSRPCLGGLAHRPGRVHSVSGQINYPLDEAPNGRCSGCGEEVWRRTDGSWTNRDGFLACAPPPDLARHHAGPDSTLCRWCKRTIRRAAVDANGASVWRLGDLTPGAAEGWTGAELCAMAPDDSMPHMPDPAVRATMPVNGSGLPMGSPGATVHMPGDRRFTLTPMEAVALIRELALTHEETHRLAARLLVRELMPGGQVMPRWLDLVDALGFVDLLPQRLEPKLSEDGTMAQIWSGGTILSEMTKDMVLSHVMEMLAVMAEIKDEAAE